MIVPYYGEFLHFPVPLEFSYGSCSHGCVYCFAKLNQRNGKIELSKAMNLLADYQNRTTLTAELLKEGYPVVLSNRCDPFAKSTYQYTLPLIKTMTDLGIPLSFETKTGPGMLDALDFLKSAVWYITIEMLDEFIAKKISPGAPPPLERLATVKTLTDMGHKVVAAINPLVSEWLPDPEPLIELFAQVGVSGVWIDQMHLSSQQVQRMTVREVETLGDDLITRAKSRGKSLLRGADRMSVLRAINLAQEYGLEVFQPGFEGHSDFFKPYYDTYDKCFPTNQGLVNFCRDEKYNPDSPFTVQDYLDFMMYRLPDGNYTGMRDYVFTGSFALRKKYKLPAGKLNYKQILAVGYDSGLIKWGLTSMRVFSWTGYTDDDGELGVTLDPTYELPYMVFIPWGSDEHYFDAMNDEVFE